VRARALNTHPGYRAEAVEPSQQVVMTGAGSGELGHAQQPANGVHGEADLRPAQSAERSWPTTRLKEPFR
jgi:hypothetical protein